MKLSSSLKLYILAISSCFSWLSCKNKAPISNLAQPEKPAYAIAIHGGAGTILRSNMDSITESKYRMALDSALSIGESILKNGGSSLDAVEKTILYLEDNPLFNAGVGAVFTNDGHNELDASIMNGADQSAGAVGSVMTIKHPISAARAVMTQSEHVMMIGKGAEAFAAKCGLEIVPNTYFYTQKRWESLQKVKAEDEDKSQLSEDEKGNKKHGTVGCVALDNNGNLAAGTSTGGMTNKRYNRVGDAPIIGAGTYADNNTCAVSCTGHGEFFIRYTVARDIAAMMEYKGSTLDEAAQYIVYDKLVKKGGEGGLIAIDKNGNIALPFNTPGMYRGYATPEKREIMIFKD